MLSMILGDTQLDSRPPCDRKDEKGRSIRFQENLETIRGAITAGYKLGCRHLIHLGDLAEEPNADNATMTAAAAMFRHALDTGFKEITGIAGNHDGSLYEISSSNVEPFTILHPDIHMFQVTQWRGDFFYLPYLHEHSPEDLGEILFAAVRLAKASPEGLPKRPVLIGHWAYQGCTVGAKNLMLPGDYLGRAQIPPEFKTVWFGHIHKGQVIEDDGHTIIFPGSAVIVDAGERLDPKNFGTYDTETGAWDLVPIPQRRRWVDVPWPVQVPGETGSPWTPSDIVRITGVREDGVNVKQELQAAFKAGTLVEPFFYRDTTILKADPRTVRSEDVAGAEDMRGAVQAYFGVRYPEDDNVPSEVQDARRRALAMILDALRERKTVNYSSVVVPEWIEGTNWMSWPAFKYKYRQGVPVLLQAPNGTGKTNFMEATLFCLTGQISKRKARMASLVRRGAQEATLTLALAGDRADFRIMRTIKLNKAGSPTQKVKLTMKAHGAEEWKSLADGGISDTQAVLRQIIGASYTSLRATRFAFQRDLSPFLDADPAERKQILTEIIGLEPLTLLYDDFNKTRNAKIKQLGDTKASLSGMLEAFNPDDIARIRAVLAQALEATEKANADKAKAEAVASMTTHKAEDAKSKVSIYETELAAVPNAAADVAAAEQALASENSSYDAALAALAGRQTAADVRVASLTAMKPAEALEAVRAALPGFQKAVADAKTSREAAGRAEADAGAVLAGLDAQITAHRGSQAKAEADYNATRDGLVTRLLGARKKVADLTTAGRGDPAMVVAETAKTDGLKAASDAAAVATLSAQAVYTKATVDLAARAAATKAARDRFLELSSKETGKCSKCGQELNTAHIEKELAELIPAEQACQKLLAEATIDAQKAEDGLNAARTAEKAASKAVSDNTALIATLARDVQDLEAARRELETVTAEGTELTAKYEAGVKVTATELETLTAGRAKCAADLAPLAYSAASAKESENRASQNLVAHEAAIRQWERNLEDLGAAKADQIFVASEKMGLDATHVLKVADINTLLDARRLLAMECETKRGNLNALLVTARGELSDAEKEAAEARATLAAHMNILVSAAANKASADGQLSALLETETKVGTARLRETTLTAEVEVLEFAVDALNPRTGLPVYLIDAKLAFLESATNAYMARLGSSRLAIKLDTLDGDKETLAILVDDGREPRLEIAVYSGGQMDRIESSFKQALTELCEQTMDVRLGMLAWDEPGIYLDEAGKAALVSIAHEKAASGDSPVVMVISNDRQISSAFSVKLHLAEDEEGGTTFA